MTPALAVLASTGRQYARQPINIVLLLLLPPLFVVALAGSLSTFSGVLGGSLTQATGAALGALWAAALLAGSAAFFMLSGTRDPDARLRVSGLGSLALNLAHAAGGAVLASVAGTVGFVMVVATESVASPLDLWVAIMLGAVAYEALGATIAFFIRGDLEGSFLLILVFMLDAFVAGPIGGASGFWPNLFPLHHPSQLVIDAVLHGDLDRTRYLWAAAYTAGLVVVSATVQARGLK